MDKWDFVKIVLNIKDNIKPKDISKKEMELLLKQNDSIKIKKK